MGWPVHRKRLFATGINQSTMVWCGPLSPADIREQFMSMFGAKVMVDADIFANTDSAEGAQAHLKELCGRRGVWPRTGQRMHVRDVLPAGAQGRYDKYMVAKSKASQATVSLKGDSDSFICDLSQNPDKRFRAGKWMPTVARSSAMCSLNTAGPTSGGHLFTAAEINLAHGWPCLQVPGVRTGSNEDFSGNLHYDEQKLTIHQQAQLAGNSMHLVTLAAWLMYVLANTVRREVYIPQALHMAAHLEETNLEPVAPLEETILETIVLGDTGDFNSDSRDPSHASLDAPGDSLNAELLDRKDLLGDGTPHNLVDELDDGTARNPALATVSQSSEEAAETGEDIIRRRAAHIALAPILWTPSSFCRMHDLAVRLQEASARSSME
jgi:hypothetical protein